MKIVPSAMHIMRDYPPQIQTDKQTDRPTDRQTHVPLNTIQVLFSSHEIHLFWGSNPRATFRLAFKGSASHQLICFWLSHLLQCLAFLAFRLTFIFIDNRFVSAQLTIQLLLLCQVFQPLDGGKKGGDPKSKSDAEVENQQLVRDASLNSETKSRSYVRYPKKG